jgi:hypothetical protein
VETEIQTTCENSTKIPTKGARTLYYLLTQLQEADAVNDSEAHDSGESDADESHSDDARKCSGDDNASSDEECSDQVMVTILKQMNRLINCN